MRRRSFLALAVAGLVLAPCLVAALLRLVRRSLFAVEVAGSSMAPTLLPGDYLLLRRSMPPAPQTFGWVVAVRDRERRLLLKRVVGLPGESLRVGQRVQVDGRPLQEPYANCLAPAQQYRAVGRLAPGELFLLGDRRDASTDSRHFGPVRAADIEAVAWFRYWPPRRIGPLPPAQRRFERRMTT